MALNVAWRPSFQLEPQLLIPVSFRRHFRLTFAPPRCTRRGRAELGSHLKIVEDCRYFCHSLKKEAFFQSFSPVVVAHLKGGFSKLRAQAALNNLILVFPRQQRLENSLNS